LLEHRDAVIADWGVRHPTLDVFEDRKLEVTGEYDISIDDQFAGVEKALKKKSAI